MRKELIEIETSFSSSRRNRSGHRQNANSFFLTKFSLFVLSFQCPAWSSTFTKLFLSFSLIVSKLGMSFFTFICGHLHLCFNRSISISQQLWFNFSFTLLLFFSLHLVNCLFFYLYFLPCVCLCHFKHFSSFLYLSCNVCLSNFSLSVSLSISKA